MDVSFVLKVNKHIMIKHASVDKYYNMYPDENHLRSMFMERIPGLRLFLVRFLLFCVQYVFLKKKNARSVKRRCPPLMGWFINPINYNYNNRKPTYAKFNQIPLIKSHLLHRGQPSLFRCFKCRARSLALDKQWDISAR